MRRYTLPLSAFAVAWVVTTIVLLPFYTPEILVDYFRIATASAFVGVAVLIVLAAVRHRAAYRRRGGMPPWLVWGMGLSYLLAAGIPAYELTERIGETLTARTPVMAVSLLLALCWLVPLVRHLR